MKDLKKKLQQYLTSRNIPEGSRLAQTIVSSTIHNYQVEYKGHWFNFCGFLQTKQLLDLTLKAEDPDLVESLLISDSALPYWYLVEHFYNSLQHDFDVKSLDTIRKEGFYVEAIEYWIDQALTRMSRTNPLVGVA